MNREIKFRAWDKEEKRMWLDGQFDFKECQLYDRLILMQYTGLKDKFDKEIFEGDIVRFPELEKIRKESVRRHKITLKEVKEAEKTGKHTHPDGTFNGGSQKVWGSYWLEHDGLKLYDRIKNEITKLEKLTNEEVKWACGRIDDGCGCCGTDFIGFELSQRREVEVIGDIYENKELLKTGN